MTGVKPRYLKVCSYTVNKREFIILVFYLKLYICLLATRWCLTVIIFTVQVLKCTC